MHELSQRSTQRAGQENRRSGESKDGAGYSTSTVVREDDARSYNTWGSMVRIREASIPSRGRREDELGRGKVMEGLWSVVAGSRA